MGLAGVDHKDDTTRIYLKKWSATISESGHRLHFETPAFGLDLELKPAKPLVRHGLSGYSRKGRLPEQASCYYSFTRLVTSGTLTLESEAVMRCGG